MLIQSVVSEREIEENFPWVPFLRDMTVIHPSANFRSRLRPSRETAQLEMREAPVLF
jgi:hypothetical protein